MGPENQKAIAKFFYERSKKGGWNQPSDKHYRTAQMLSEEDDWNTMTDDQKGAAAKREMLIEHGYYMDTCLIEFVRYDEDLYRALVDLGAMTCRKGKLGQVSLHVKTLGQYC
jgi:hypothetical protein